MPAAAPAAEFDPFDFPDDAAPSPAVPESPRAYSDVSHLTRDNLLFTLQLKTEPELAAKRADKFLKGVSPVPEGAPDPAELKKPALTAEDMHSALECEHADCVSFLRAAPWYTRRSALPATPR